MPSLKRNNIVILSLIDGIIKIKKTITAKPKIPNLSNFLLVWYRIKTEEAKTASIEDLEVVTKIDNIKMIKLVVNKNLSFRSSCENSTEKRIGIDIAKNAAVAL